MTFFDILKLACDECRLECAIHHGHQFASVRDSSGRNIRVLQSRFPLNLATGARAAGDKSITKSLLLEAGCLVVKGWTVDLTVNWQGAFDHFSQLGRVAIVKPLSGERGSLVFLCRNEGQLAFALSQIASRHNSAILEEYIDGREYRVLVLDSRPLYVLERRKLTLVGDGTSTIVDLLAGKASSLLPSLLADPRMTLMAGTPPPSRVLSAGVPFLPVPVANASGASTFDVAPTLCPDIVRLAATAVAAIGLRYAGVDLLVETNSGCAAILEINSAPEIEGFDSAGAPCLESSIATCKALLFACFS